MNLRTPWWIRIPAIFLIIVVVLELVIDSGDKLAVVAYPISLFFLVLVLLLLIAIELIVGAIENVMFRTLSPEAQERYLLSKKQKWEWTWGKRTYKKLLGNRPIEEENEIVLDHNYDGIQELDNTLPPWWVYLFYATIIFGVVYLVRFHVIGDYTQAIEYEQEVAEARQAIEIYRKNAKDLVDANSVTVSDEVADLNAGKKIFNSNCAVCHLPDGGGGIGPNLTDAYWILGGGIKNVFTTISEGGRDGKGMIAWKQSLKPAQIAQVSSYVLSLQGTTPANPKLAEGDLWVNDEIKEIKENIDETIQESRD